jgi:hypothetical protein
MRDFNSRDLDTWLRSPYDDAEDCDEETTAGEVTCQRCGTTYETDWADREWVDGDIRYTEACEGCNIPFTIVIGGWDGGVCKDSIAEANGWDDPDFVPNTVRPYFYSKVVAEWKLMQYQMWSTENAYEALYYRMAKNCEQQEFPNRYYSKEIGW